MAAPSQFTVCSRCFTFNHEAYIVDALKGFTSQETSFPVVSVIVDDASVDQTPDQILSFYKQHFDWMDPENALHEETEACSTYFARHRTNTNCFFAVILLKENHYSRGINKRPYYSRWIDHSKYVAICEGDDYWTDPKKLQRQVEYMEQHPGCCMCSHAALWELHDNVRKKGCDYPHECDIPTDEVIREGGYYLTTASLIHKMELDFDRPAWREAANVGDFPLQILGSLRGNLHFLPEVMCTYRYMVQGSFSDLHREWKPEYLFQKLSWMKLLDQDTKHSHRKAIYYNLFNTCYTLLYKSRSISLFPCLLAILRSDRKVHNLKVLRQTIRSRRKAN